MNSPDQLTKLTLQDWITSSGKFPERAQSVELTEEIIKSAQELIDKVNGLLDEIGYTGKRVVSSGFRPSVVNLKTPGAAKKSGHQSGLALDLEQPKARNEIAELVRSHQKNLGLKGILGKYGLMMEKPEFTIGKWSRWTHFDLVKRKERPDMEFIP